MGLTFTWDAKKASKNLQKHKIAFVEAATIFGDPFSITMPDPDHSALEERFISMGMSNQKRLLVVVHTEIRNQFRLISSRIASREERTFYEEGNC